MYLKIVYVDRVNRFAFEVDEESGRTFVSIPVRNTMVEYSEWYELDRATFTTSRPIRRAHALVEPRATVSGGDNPTGRSRKRLHVTLRR